MVGILAGANAIAFPVVYLAISVAAIVLLGYADYGWTWPALAFPLNLAVPAFELRPVIGIVLADLMRNRGTAQQLDAETSAEDRQPGATAGSA
jgi:hypothetical protein